MRRPPKGPCPCLKGTRLWIMCFRNQLLGVPFGTYSFSARRHSCNLPLPRNFEAHPQNPLLNPIAGLVLIWFPRRLGKGGGSRRRKWMDTKDSEVLWVLRLALRKQEGPPESGRNHPQASCFVGGGGRLGLLNGGTSVSW